MHPIVERYQKVTVPSLKENKAYASVYQIPRLTQVTVNMGIGKLVADSKNVEQAKELITAITGQTPVITKARKAISGFKIRIGMPVGMKVTLRGDRMNDFLIKLIEIVLPRTRDFRGIPLTSITADGNLNIGIKDSMIFPDAPIELPSFCLQVCITSTAKTLEESTTLYQSLGFHFAAPGEFVKAKKNKSKQYRK